MSYSLLVHFGFDSSIFEGKVNEEKLSTSIKTEQQLSNEISNEDKKQKEERRISNSNAAAIVSLPKEKYVTNPENLKWDRIFKGLLELRSILVI